MLKDMFANVGGGQILDFTEILKGDEGYIDGVVFSTFLCPMFFSGPHDILV